MRTISALHVSSLGGKDMFNREVFDTLNSIIEKIQKMPLRVSGEVVQLKKPAEMPSGGHAAGSSARQRVNSTPVSMAMHRKASTTNIP